MTKKVEAKMNKELQGMTKKINQAERNMVNKIKLMNEGKKLTTS